MFLAFPSENERMVCVGCSLAFMIGLESRERLETCGKMLLSSLWPCGLCFSVAFLRPKSHGPWPQAKIIHKEDVYVSVLYFMLGTEKLKKHYYLIALTRQVMLKVVSSSTLTEKWYTQTHCSNSFRFLQIDDLPFFFFTENICSSPPYSALWMCIVWMFWILTTIIFEGVSRVHWEGGLHRIFSRE